MDITKLLSDPAAVAAIISVLLAAILTYITTILTQLWNERHQRLQVTFSRRTEAPTILAESEINRKLRISYQGKDVTDLKFFSVNIINSGKQIINDFQFLCEFDINVRFIDTSYPYITTKTPPTIQSEEPILDQVNSKNNKFIYATKSLAVGQQIKVDFLFSDCKTDKFDVRFIHANYARHEGTVSESPTLEKNAKSVLYNLAIFYIITQVSPIIPFLISLILGLIIAIFGLGSLPVFTTPLGFLVAGLAQLGNLAGVLIGLPFLLRAFQSALPIIPVLARKIREVLER